MTGQKASIMGLPVSFFFLILLFCLLATLLLITLLRYLCLKFEFCVPKGSEAEIIMGAGAESGEDVLDYQVNEKPPSYDEVMKKQPQMPYSQIVYNIQPKYEDLYGFS